LVVGDGPAACYRSGVDTLLHEHGAALVGWSVVGFLAGSIPFGLLLALAVGKTDVRTAGSGNIGATNVARVVGKKLGLVTLVLDALKAVVPIVVVTHVVPVNSNERVTALHGAIVGLCALLGHCYTPWLRFRGGKGVATGLGVLLALHPAVAGVGLVAFGIVFAARRMVSVASLFAALVVIATLLLRGPVDVAVVPIVLCLVVIIVRHTENIRRVLHKQELSL
jgi:glycerol-3-phosphate acyltransferase PlsY